MHKILQHERYNVAPLTASDHKVNLVKSDTDQQVIAEGLSLQELYDNHVSPGKLLYLTDYVSKGVGDNFETLQTAVMQSKHINYALIDAHTHIHKIKHSQKGFKQHAGLKNVIFLVSNPVGYTRLALDRAYQFIEAGCPVEFRIRLVGPILVKRFKGVVPSEVQTWMHDHFPHLRPDFILKSMPEGTKYLIKPYSDRQTIQFVVAKEVVQGPKIDLTTRLERVRQAVVKSLPNNKMAQNYLARKEKRGKGLAGEMEKGSSVSKEAKENRYLNNIKSPKLRKNISRTVDMEPSLTEDPSALRDDEDARRAPKGKGQDRFSMYNVVTRRPEHGNQEKKNRWDKRGGR